MIMRQLFFLIILNSFGLCLNAQEQFFNFLPGWRNQNIVEITDSYISVGVSIDSIPLNHYQFSKLSLNGEILANEMFFLDTLQSISSLSTNDISIFNNNLLITGRLKGVLSDRFYGSYIRLKNDLSDTIMTKSFNLLPGNGTMIRTHHIVNDTTLILGGYLQDTNFTIYSALIETDTLGNIQWRQNYFCGNNCELKPYHIMKAADNGYFFTCKELDWFEWPYFNEKTTIIKTDSLGNEQYRLHPGNPDLFTVAGWVLPTDDGNYITAYSDPMTITDYLPQLNIDNSIWLHKFDIEGNEIFNINLYNDLPKIFYDNEYYGYTYYITQLLETNDGNILISGYKTALVDQGFLVKVTQEGELLWYRFISPPQAEGNDAAFESTKILGITPTSDGGYIMAGEYISTAGNIFPEDIQTAIAVKVDEFGCLEPGCQLADAIYKIPKTDLGLRVYPNPASEVVNVSVRISVSLFDCAYQLPVLISQ